MSTVKMVAAARRKPGMTHAEFIEYIEHAHGKIARDKPLTVKKYNQNHIFDSAFGPDTDITYSQDFHRDSITELYFDDFAAVIKTFSDPYTQQVIGPDGRNFADLAHQLAQLMTETEIAVPTPGAANFKVMHLIKKAVDIKLEDFFQAWSLAHDAAQESCADFRKAIRKHARAQYIPEGDRVTAYFGPGVKVCEGMSSMWFETEADLPAFREYQRLITRNLAEAGVINPAESFFVYCKEVSIFDFS